MDTKSKKETILCSIKDIFSDLETLKNYSSVLSKDIEEKHAMMKKEIAEHDKNMEKRTSELYSLSIAIEEKRQELAPLDSKIAKIKSSIELLDLEMDRKITQNNSIKEKSMDFDNRERTAKRLEERVLKDEALFKIRVAEFEEKIEGIDEKEKALKKRDREQEDREMYLQEQRNNIKSRLPENFDGKWENIKIIQE